MFITLLALGVPFPGLWALWVALVDFLPIIGGALAGHPGRAVRGRLQSAHRGHRRAVVFLVYTQIENHILNPIIMSKTVRISPLLVLISVLVGASLGDWVGGIFGGFVAALLAIPAAGALQVIVRRDLAAHRPAAGAAEGGRDDQDGRVGRDERACRWRRGQPSTKPSRPRNRHRRRTQQAEPTPTVATNGRSAGRRPTDRRFDRRSRFSVSASCPIAIAPIGS